MLVHPLHDLLDLRALLRRKHVHDLRTQLLVGLPAGLCIDFAAVRVRLAEVPDDLTDLRTLGIAQVDAVERPHEAVMPVVAGALGSRRRRLLRENGSGRDERGAHRRGKKKRTKESHRWFTPWKEVVLTLTHDAGDLA